MADKFTDVFTTTASGGSAMVKISFSGDGEMELKTYTQAEYMKDIKDFAIEAIKDQPYY